MGVTYKALSVEERLQVARSALARQEADYFQIDLDNNSPGPDAEIGGQVARLERAEASITSLQAKVAELEAEVETTTGEDNS